MAHARIDVLAACLALLFAAAPAWAGLTWQDRDLKRQAQFTDEQVQAEFVFTNTGEKPVAITSVRSSCGCTIATLEKKTYAPDEQGRLTATYTLSSTASRARLSGGGASGGGGEQVKQIIVRTDDPTMPVVRLTLRVDVPQLISMQPRLLFWRADEPRETKTIAMQLGEAEGLRLVGVRVGGAREQAAEDPALRGLRTGVEDDDADDEPVPTVQVSATAGVSVELKPVEGNPRQYKLAITPAVASAHERIELDVLLPNGQVYTAIVQARVFPQVQAADERAKVEE